MVQKLKKSQSSDSSVSIKGNVTIGGDGAIGKNARILKEDTRFSLFKLLCLIAGFIASLIAIYSFFSKIST
jgi:hypothetical protein